MSDRTVIRKVEISVDQPFPTTLEFGRINVAGTGEVLFYLLHTVSRHWDENLYVFETDVEAMTALVEATRHACLGIDIPREFAFQRSSVVKF